MSRGRRPLPTIRLHETPQPEPCIPPEPELVATDPVAHQEWQRIATEMDANGMLTGLDMALLASYAIAFARWVQACEETRQNGEVVRSPSGFPQISPWATVRDRAHKQLLQLADSLGLSVAARGRIRMPAWIERDEPPNPKRRFFADGAISRVPSRNRYPEAIAETKDETRDKSRFIAD